MYIYITMYVLTKNKNKKHKKKQTKNPKTQKKYKKTWKAKDAGPHAHICLAHALGPSGGSISLVPGRRSGHHWMPEAVMAYRGRHFDPTVLMFEVFPVVLNVFSVVLKLFSCFC